MRKLKYSGAGTIEFLYENGEFYFIEMNTRLQVEHPVTERITNMDIVYEQIRVAAGEKLSLTQDEITYFGHAIECRINAEDAETFAPSPGTITYYHPAGGVGVRVDSSVYQGYKIPPYYDSLIGKLIVHGRTREECLMRLRRALDEFIVDGVKTTLPLFRRLIDEKAVQDADYDIHWLEGFLDTSKKNRASFRRMSRPDPFELEITPDLIVRAYQAGIFPMAEHAEDEDVFWVSPERRGILPLDGFHLSKSLKKAMKRPDHEIRVDSDFEAVIEGCATAGSDRDSTWINATIRNVYGELFARRICHTVEVWSDGELVGGLYGLAIGGGFFGESMFHKQDRRLQDRAGPSGRPPPGRRLHAFGHPVPDRSPQIARRHRDQARSL